MVPVELGVFKSVCSHLDLASLLLLWSHCQHWVVESPGSVLQVPDHHDLSPEPFFLKVNLAYVLFSLSTDPHVLEGDPHTSVVWLDESEVALSDHDSLEIAHIEGRLAVVFRLELRICVLDGLSESKALSLYLPHVKPRLSGEGMHFKAFDDIKGDSRAVFCMLLLL